jgi:hypothetical protein
MQDMRHRIDRADIDQEVENNIQVRTVHCPLNKRKAPAPLILIFIPFCLQ